MANENKNTKELVAADDDVTAELQELTLQQVLTRAGDFDGDSVDDDTATFDLERVKRRRANDDVAVLRANLEARADTISRLQFDVEQIRARFQGLQAEIQARETVTRDLQNQVAELADSLASKSRRLRERDKEISQLRAEIRERQVIADEAAAGHADLVRERDELLERTARLEQDLADRGSEIETLEAARDRAEARALERERQPGDESSAADDLTAQNERALTTATGALAAAEAERREARDSLARTESYADELRRRVEDQVAATAAAEKASAHLEAERDELAAENAAMADRLALAAADNKALGEQVARMQHRHNDEAAAFEADLERQKDALAASERQQANVVAELDQSQAYREEIERMLTRTNREHDSSVAELRERIEYLEACNEAHENTLTTKNAAIECLLSELTEKHRRTADGRADRERSDADPAAAETAGGSPAAERERVNRLLVGRIDNQELRFPLFKKRLTIGRTQENDIQLNVPYISRRHAVLSTEGDVTRVIDWGSKNGVYVNAERVTERFLKSGDKVTIGNAEFRYEERQRRDA